MEVFHIHGKLCTKSIDCLQAFSDYSQELGALAAELIINVIFLYLNTTYKMYSKH